MFSFYNAPHPIVRQVLKGMILGIPLAVGQLLQLATAQAGTCNSQKKHNRTLANDWMNRVVLGWAVDWVRNVVGES